MVMSTIPLTPADVEATGWLDWVKTAAIGLAVATLVFLSVIGWLTLQNTYSIVGGHSDELTQLKADVMVVDGYGAGFEWQNALICSALHINCVISPPGPPPHRLRK